MDSDEEIAYWSGPNKQMFYIKWSSFFRLAIRYYCYYMDNFRSKERIYYFFVGLYSFLLFYDTLLALKRLIYFAYSYLCYDFLMLLFIFNGFSLNLSFFADILFDQSDI